MASQIKDIVCDLLQYLHDDQLVAENGVKRGLAKVAMLDASAYEMLLKRLASPPPGISLPVLQLLLSSNECGDALGKCLIDSFPALPDHFSPSSTVVDVLKTLSISIPFLHEFERDTSMKLNDCHAKVEYSPLVIEALITFIATSSNRETENEMITEEGPLIRTKQSQRQRKGAKTRPLIIDTKLRKAFQIVGASPPTSESQARPELYTLFKELWDILKFYLGLLRDPAMELSIRGKFSPAPAEIIEEISKDEGEDKHDCEVSESVPIIPAAFPMVQPMKAALYFDSAEGFGDWRILISTRADRDLREARRKDAKFFKIVIKKIKELSNGHFSDDNQKRLNGSNTEIPIYEAKMTRDSRLVYQIDCIPEYDAEIERQVIKIFGVYTHAQIDKRLWDSVGYQLAKRGKQYRQRCLYRNQPSLAGDKVFSPASFPPPEKVEEEEEYFVPELPRESLEEMHSLLVLEKFITFSQALLNSIMADLDVAHVFNVSPQEKEIVEYPYSCYVLGRSGTGKTTTMLFKMLGIERAYTMRKDSMPKPRQIFVTQSRVLAGKVEEYFSKLLDSLSTADRTREELAAMIKSKRQRQEEEGLVDVDDDHNWRADLPRRFSELQDKHFPLFLTFDRLSSLLEADISQDVRFVTVSSTEISQEDPSEGKSLKLVSYDAFLASYWPHFSQNLRKGLDPALVYSELMGVIQGSEESLNQETRYLHKAAYESLSHRVQHTFSNRRGVIYSIFLAYLKQKKLSNEYDAADRTHRILNAFQNIGIPGQKIDYLYVDEAQDNLLIDALLLRSLVRNPDGLFWAGDTAQTISVGSSFRFNDLKAFLFRLEKQREESILGSGSPFIQEAPRTFQLAVNYRSHGGIVHCAHSVIELITEFWPYAIDILSRERGVVDGSKPVFFSGWDSETVRYEQFLFGESGNPIEFGAQQCILVRNEAAREELRTQVGDIGLIMTLYESKGLEFDDVLLYKFFEDSSVDLSQWRVVLNLLGNTHGLDIPAPQFDDARHAGICSELKFLYVAITRARKNLWIVDCSEKSEPMRIFWTSRDEVQNCTPGTDVPRLAVSSSPEEWEKSGKTLFTNKRYLQAMHCFERAGLNREVAVSHTYYLREQARATISNGSKQGNAQRQRAFLTAADAFVQCSISAVNVKEKTTYLRNAGACFEAGEDEFKAAEAYNQAHEFTKAVKLYRKCARFDEAVAVVTQNRQHVEPEVAENIIDIARLFYFKGGELEKATRLFESVEEQLEYLEDFDLDLSRAALLESLGKYQDAAEIHLSEGRTLEAIRLFFMHDTDAVSIRRGQQCVLQGLWEIISFGVGSSGRQADVERLLKLASSVKSSHVTDPDIADELSMFQTVKLGDLRALRLLGRRFASQNKTSSALLCFDHAFNVFPDMYKMPSAEISELLQDFLSLCQFTFRTATIQNPCQEGHIQKLFCFRPSSESNFLLPTGTFLHEQLIESRAALVGSNEQGILVSEWELARRFKQLLMGRLMIRIRAQNDACRRAQAFTPCIPFIANGNCNRIDCPRVHLQVSSLTLDWFTLQVRIHLQQILIIQGFLMVPISPSEKIKVFRYWVNRLFETLHPPFFRLGDVANLDISSIPQALKAFSVLNSICTDILFWRNYLPKDSKLLSTTYQISRLAFHLGTASKQRIHLNKAPLINSFRPAPDFWRTNGDLKFYILPELVLALSGDINGVSCGILFIRHILDTMLPIDINVLCDLIDVICGSVILLRKNTSLHNVTLPFSWFNSLLRFTKFDFGKKVPTLNILINIFIGSLGQLVDFLYTGQQRIGHLLVENTDLFNLFGHRGIYISRLCRAIGLVGYNVNNPSLRVEIVATMKKLKDLRTPNNLFKDYALSKSWSDVEKAVQKSMADTPLDGMVQLYHASEVARGMPPPRGVRRVIYQNMADIPRLLDGSTKFSNLRPDAPAFVPKPRITDAPAVEDDADPDTEEPEVDNSEIVNNSATVESIAVAELPNDTLVPSEEQNNAAKLFLAMYRKLMRRRSKGNRTTLEVLRNSCFEECLAEFTNMEWPEKSLYRFLFLGPLPHVLVCLKAAYSWAMDNKQRNKKRFKTATHQELDEVNKRLTDQKKIIDEIINLQKSLNPQSPLHRKRDIEELKKVVRQVEEMLGRVAPSVARDVADDMERGMKGIVVVKRVKKPKAKPALRMDDDEAVDDDERYAEKDGELRCMESEIQEEIEVDSDMKRGSDEEHHPEEQEETVRENSTDDDPGALEGEDLESLPATSTRAQSPIWMSVPAVYEGVLEPATGRAIMSLSWSPI